jgi:hypothetical protein
MDNQDSKVTTGNVTGTGIAIGAGAQATVIISQQAQKEVLSLLSLLREQLEKSDLPEGAKNVLLNKAVPEMETAVQSPDPKPALSRGLERINDQLEGVGAAAKNVSGIVDTIAKIAGVVGIGVKAVAPFIASLL